LADLEARTTPASRLLLGLGCCWAAAVIVQENLAPGLSAASTTGNKVMSSYVRSDASLFSQRTTTLAVIVGLHVALVFAFGTGLGPKVVAALPIAFQASVLPEVRDPPPAPPPMRDPTLIHPRLDNVPTPELNIVVDTGPDAIREAAQTPPVVQPNPAPPAPQVVHRVQGNAGKGFPNSADYYPPSALRLGETGTAIVQVCVNRKGYLTGAPTLAQSTGSPRLDEGALKLARAGSGHYRPTTENDQAVDSCFPLDITFNIRG
jgi:protein TonB